MKPGWSHKRWLVEGYDRTTRKWALLKDFDNLHNAYPYYLACVESRMIHRFDEFRISLVTEHRVVSDA